MATTAQNVIDDAEDVLQDTSNYRWTADYLLKGVNLGSKKISTIKPDAYIKGEAVVTVEGPVQSLPADGIQLQMITHNMGTAGTTPGNAIRLRTLEQLYEMNPLWVTVTGNATMQFYAYDNRIPLKYFCYPPQPSASQGYVYMFYGAVPAEVAVDASILVSEIYRPALVDYVLYWAYLMDADYAPNAQRALAHLAAFGDALGARQQIEDMEDPNRIKALHQAAGS